MEKKRKKKGGTISPSQEACEVMRKNAFNAKPRMTIREYVNVLNGLPKEL